MLVQTSVFLKDWTPGPIISPVSVLSALETTISIHFLSKSHHIPIRIPWYSDEIPNESIVSGPSWSQQSPFCRAFLRQVLHAFFRARPSHFGSGAGRNGGQQQSYEVVSTFEIRNWGQVPKRSLGILLSIISPFFLVLGGSRIYLYKFNLLIEFFNPAHTLGAPACSNSRKDSKVGKILPKYRDGLWLFCICLPFLGLLYWICWTYSWWPYTVYRLDP